LAGQEKPPARFGNGESRRALHFVLETFSSLVFSEVMDDKFTPADPRDLADAIAFSLRFEGRKRVHQADEYMASIAAQRVVRHLERAGFVVLKKPPLGGHSAIGRGFEG
jgi:hypothetical protein